MLQRKREWGGGYAPNNFNVVFIYVFQSKEVFHAEKLYESFIFKSKERADLHLTQVWIYFTFQEGILNQSADYKVK